MGRLHPNGLVPVHDVVSLLNQRMEFILDEEHDHLFNESHVVVPDIAVGEHLTREDPLPCAEFVDGGQFLLLVDLTSGWT